MRGPAFGDLAYYRQRAQEEDAAAASSLDKNAAAAHEAMAREYRAQISRLTASLGMVEPVQGVPFGLIRPPLP